MAAGQSGAEHDHRAGNRPDDDANLIVSGKVMVRVTNASKPSLMVYAPPAAKNNGAPQAMKQSMHV